MNQTSTLKMIEYRNLFEITAQAISLVWCKVPKKFQHKMVSVDISVRNYQNDVKYILLVQITDSSKSLVCKFSETILTIVVLVVESTLFLCLCQCSKIKNS